jgi:uncharacterized membrane protein YfcA
VSWSFSRLECDRGRDTRRWELSESQQVLHESWPVAAIAIGVVSGASSGAFGVGGGVVNKPLLRLILRTAPGSVLGSPIPAQFFGALLGTVSYHRRRMINYRLVGMAAPFAVAGTVLGAYATSLVKHDYLMVLLALVVLWAGLRMLDKSFRQPDRDSEPPLPITLPRTSVTAFLAGVAAGLLGLGGGFLLVPAFNVLLKREIKESIASSLAIIAFTSIPNGITHWILGHVEWTLASYLLIGQMIGVWFGTLFTVKSSRRLVYLLFGLFLAGVALALARLEIANTLRGF